MGTVVVDNIIRNIIFLRIESYKYLNDEFKHWLFSRWDIIVSERDYFLNIPTNCTNLQNSQGEVTIRFTDSQLVEMLVLSAPLSGLTQLSLSGPVWPEVSGARSLSLTGRNH